MSTFGLHRLNDLTLALVVGILLLVQLALFILVGCLVILPVWLVSHWRLDHHLTQHSGVSQIQP